MNRTEQAIEQFTTIATDLTLELRLHTADEWFADAGPDESNLHRPFGFLPPTLDTLDLSAEVIVEQCRGLSDDDFGHYLNALDVHICGHITHFENPDAERIIDRALYDLAPDAAALLSEVQMQALDRCAQ